jgi:hypothetical protein
MNEQDVKVALFLLLQEGVSDVLPKLAYSISTKGYDRVAVLRFFHAFIEEFEARLSEADSMLLYDFCVALQGQCPIEEIPRLHGDPTEPNAFVEKVYADLKAARRSSRSPRLGRKSPEDL